MVVYNQFSLWNEEQLAPRRETKTEVKHKLLREKTDHYIKSLLERVVLSDEETLRYNIPLTKKNLINSVQIYNRNWREIFNPGVPQMLLETLSQYSKKQKEDLSVSDLVIMYKSMVSAFKTVHINDMQVKSFKYQNGLSFFGVSQFEFMGKYLEAIRTEEMEHSAACVFM